MKIIGKQQLLAFLKPGDILLYDTSGFIGWAIRTKTYSDVSHAETYIGNGQSAASRGPNRDKATGLVGVRTYPLRIDQLKYVYRPIGPFNFEAGLAWHNSVIGQGYDFLGLLTGFYTAGGHGAEGKQFCSEHACRFAKHEGLALFPADYDCDKVSPGDLKKTTGLKLVLRSVKDVLYV